MEDITPQEPSAPVHNEQIGAVVMDQQEGDVVVAYKNKAKKQVPKYFTSTTSYGS